MNDSYACIPPGTPVSLESRRSATTRGSSGCALGGSESESIVSHGNANRDNASGYEAMEKWSFLPLPNLPNIQVKRCAQFSPLGLSTHGKDIGDTDRQDMTSLSISNQTSNTIACTDNSFQHRLLSTRPLTSDDENPLNLGSMENVDERHRESTNATDCFQKAQHYPSTQIIEPTKDTLPMSPSSLFYIMEQEHRLSSIPKEIIISSDQMEDIDDDSLPEEPYTHEAIGKSRLSSHWIRPSPKDCRRQRRYQLPFVQLDMNGFVCQEPNAEVPSDVSFTDIVCRHVKRSKSLSSAVSSVEDECSLPLFIEVNRSLAIRSNFIWRTQCAPEYASV